MYLLDLRAFAASVCLDNNTIWIVGGRDRDSKDRDLATSEFVLAGEWMAHYGRNMPFTISSHGMVKFDDDTIFIMGGRQNGSVSRQTWIVNPKDNFSIREGPSMLSERALFSCGKMELNGKSVIVVAGGDWGTSILDTVEILDPSDEEGWVWGKISFSFDSFVIYSYLNSGPTLPYKLYGSAMVTSPNGKGVVLVGGYDATHMKYSSDLLELKQSSEEWIVLEQQLQYPRFRHLAFSIPSDLTKATKRSNYHPPPPPPVEDNSAFFNQELIVLHPLEI